MRKKICVSKQLVVVFSIVVFILSLILVLSFSLLAKKQTIQSKAAPSQSNTAIVGGTDAQEGRWPFVVRLISDSENPYKSGFCDGTLITPQWILTAGHCVKYMSDNPREYSVYVGLMTLPQGPEEKNIYKIIQKEVYPSYFIDGPYEVSVHDIALLKLERKVSSKIKPIYLADTNEFKEGQKVVEIGWGETGLGEQSQKLNFAAVPILSHIRIKQWGDYYSSSIYESNLVEGFPQGGVGQCSGDSGGPVVVWNGKKWMQVGVISRSQKGYVKAGQQHCGNPHNPGVSTLISYKGKDKRDNNNDVPRGKPRGIWLTE